ncbi:MAG: histidine ammonia-lyase [bacterium]|uniref:Histidine ammonia-lyase n=1 Tax=Candidatus Aphodosoma intestinipullorum TaxID=2840674 RepID=A0A940IE62_9BACT|nr:histidine ammonia-lyase [Candidatus Aphodosoma intestinipullorum]
MKIHEISPAHLTIDDIRRIVREGYQLKLSEESVRRIQACRDYLDNKMKTQKEPIYGVTTGFGSLCNISVGADELSQLQKNLVMSHACGTGDEVDREIVKIIIFLKIQSLQYGVSGVQVATVQRLVDMFNNDVLPVIYQLGSLGASGDLAPLAHMSLPLLGLGEVWFDGKKRPAAEVNRHFGWEPITLKSKEGLALLNGTQFMAAHAVWALIKADEISRAADTIGAVSLDAFDGRIEPFTHEVHAVRPHKGQIETAARMRELLAGSEIIKQHKAHVQDPYSFRCIPQVHGASKDAIAYVRSVIETEINSATDNPTVIPEKDMVISAGNFHGQPLAITMDFLSIALAELGSISGQRINQLISGKRGLPSFLVAKPGLNSGFMIPQYAAASIVSQSKQLCMPASVDSIESSQGQEDHVSMGANAATKLCRVALNTERILGIELFNAAQALEFRRPMKSSPVIEKLVAEYRKAVPFVDVDQVMYPHIEESIQFIRRNF